MTNKNDSIQSVHDAIFKLVMADLEFVQLFFARHLETELLNRINLETLCPADTQQISKDLLHYQMDVLFWVKYRNKRGGMYLLVEHKSRLDKQGIEQSTRYAFLLRDRLYKQGKSTGQPPDIHCVVFCHGASTYQGENTLSAVLPKKSMLRRMLEKGVQVIDLRRIQDTSLQSNDVMSIMMLLFKYVGTKSFVEVFCGLLPKLYAAYEEHRKLVSGMIKYSVASIPKSQMVTVSEAVKATEKQTGGNETMISIADVWMSEAEARGAEKGRQEGRQEGYKQGFEAAAQQLQAENEAKMKALIDMNVDPKVINVVFGDQVLKGLPITAD